VFVIPILVLLCLTGIVFLFRPQLESLQHGDAMHPAVRGFLPHDDPNGRTLQVRACTSVHQGGDRARGTQRRQSRSSH